MRVDTGGAESNVAIGLVRAGVPATWVGRVGADPAGDRVLRDVRQAGVDVVAVSGGERDADRGEYPDIDMVFDPEGYARRDGTRYDATRPA